ncbi:beta-agarase [Coraliomargarita akajimensis]|uniref:Beta-agarase n=1 Tax=Coraliomargarita akajimensis (strain DSM 45221 / IAM 15411 / JCM 23193 / KCTC 12865 / 04OKA010-24) TaxID=583355 RepID=D5EMI3_CORAD|nr:beta-agarase [Coraliomargarita akajimensis]ADE53389.1 Beta-agarase [Coraliomargarita akajimensis DSM 45221]
MKALLKSLPFLLHLASIPVFAASNDWDRIPIPVEPERGMRWKLIDPSDDFNYTARADKKTKRFEKRWTEGFINQWTGPGLTEWQADHSEVADGTLKIKVTRKPGHDRLVHAGCISSYYPVKYPLFIETRAKLSKLPTASCVWMLSQDSTQEIDVLEAYGSDRPDQEWFAQRLHLSHHVFIRNPFTDYQPKDDGSWHYDGTTWADDYVRVGVYWRDPWHLEYYINGKHVRTVSGKEIIDPHGYTDGTGLNKPMYVIINAENQEWRTDQDIEPTDQELADSERSTMLVDWVRIYQAVKR